MSWTFVSSGGASTAGSATSITQNLTSVHAGDLAVIWAKWEGAAGSPTCSDGTSSLTPWAPGVISQSGAEPFGCIWYLLASVATGTVTYTISLGAGRAFRDIEGMIWTPSAAASLDGTAQGAYKAPTTTPTSDNITTSGTDGLAFGVYGDFSGTTNTSPLINAIAADRFENGPTGHSSAIWAKTYSAGFTGPAKITAGASVDSLMGIIAFKIGAAATAVVRPNRPIQQAVKRASYY